MSFISSVYQGCYHTFVGNIIIGINGRDVTVNGVSVFGALQQPKRDPEVISTASGLTLVHGSVIKYRSGRKTLQVTRDGVMKNGTYLVQQPATSNKEPICLKITEKGVWWKGMYLGPSVEDILHGMP